jgi:hypothetical protein
MAKRVMFLLKLKSLDACIATENDNIFGKHALKYHYGALIITLEKQV